MDRVPDFESVGCAFEPRRGRLYRGLKVVGRHIWWFVPSDGFNPQKSCKKRAKLLEFHSTFLKIRILQKTEQAEHLNGSWRTVKRSMPHTLSE